MELAEFAGIGRSDWPLLAFEDWSERFEAICGRFQIAPRQRHGLVTGAVSVLDGAGIEVVQVANDLDAIRREPRDMRSFHGEYLFLLLQLDGVCDIEQFGQKARIAPGDFILVDSASPVTFGFDGRFSNQLSAHLPRQRVLDDCAEIAIGQTLPAADPMSIMLRGLVAKLIKTDAADRRAPQLRQLLFDASRQAFARGDDGAVPSPSGSASGRLGRVQALIDRHLTDAGLTPQWLAEQAGVSLRTLQADLARNGITLTSLIRSRRLAFARHQLAARSAGGGLASIADVAYASGFNDISYFNRCIRKAFGCSPKQLRDG